MKTRFPSIPGFLWVFMAILMIASFAVIAAISPPATMPASGIYACSDDTTMTAPSVGLDVSRVSTLAAAPEFDGLSSAWGSAEVYGSTSTAKQFDRAITKGIAIHAMPAPTDSTAAVNTACTIYEPAITRSGVSASAIAELINPTSALFLPTTSKSNAGINQAAAAPLSGKNQYRGIDDRVAGLITSVTQGGISAGGVQPFDINAATSHAFLVARSLNCTGDLRATTNGLSSSNVASVLIFKTRGA